MNAQINKSTICHQICGAVFMNPAPCGFIAMITIILLCPLASAQTYEVIENGQVYLVEVVEEDFTATTGDPKDPNEYADEISKKHDRIHANLGLLLDRAINDSGDFFTDKQKEKFLKLRGEKERSEKAKKRLDENGGFKQVGRKNDFNKKNKDKDDEYEADTYVEYSESLDVLNDALVQADQELEIAIDAKNRYMVIKMTDASEDKCQDLVNAKDDLRIAAAVLRSLTIVAQTALDCCSATFGQTIGGYNLQALCNIPAIAVGAFDLAAYGCETADEMASADAEAACMNQLDDMNLSTYEVVLSIGEVTQGTAADVNDLSAEVKRLSQAVKNLNKRLDALEKRIDDRFADLNAMLAVKFELIETLLKMPQGQRPEFPQK